ncbi:hypothetical protein [Mycobacterium scrofulaceum]|uniref:hypothetical protein n=1 Tax=Mycobacterium scrofulaceum TaxID=1783 RepID=UPI000A56A50F
MSSRTRLGLETATLLGAFVITTLGTAPPGSAAGDWGLNGTYTATSNGEWAKTNEIFHNEASIRSIWTINTTCSYPTECTGTVVSDWGWRAPIYQTGGVWFVKHIVDNWQPCPDGTAAQGFQVFRFAPTNPDGDTVDPASPVLTGADETTGISGACGRSKTWFISMPFKLVKTR